MHKTHAVNNWLLWFAVLLPWGTMAADPPPPLVRSVLSTNLPAFGTTGQALFRLGVSPYLNWSNAPNQAAVNAGSNSLYVLLSNMLVSVTGNSSNFIVSAHGTLNVSNDAVFGTNKMLITTNGNVWKKGMIVSDFGLAVGTNTAAMWGYWPDEATTSSAFESFRDTDKEYPFNELALGLKSGLGSGLFCGFGTEMNQNGAGFFLQATTNINTSSYFWVDLNNGSNATYQTKFYMKHLGTNLFWMGEGGDWTNRGYHVSRDLIVSNNATVNGWLSQTSGTNYGSSGKTNYTWTDASGFHNTNTAGGMIDGQNGSLTISMPPGGSTNALTIIGTNGIGKGHDVVVDSMGRVGVGTNMPQALVDIQGTNSGNGYLFRVANPMIANATNTFVVATNNKVGIGVSTPSQALDVTGSIKASSSLICSGTLVHGNGAGMQGFAGNVNTVSLFTGSGINLASYQIVGGGGVGSPSNNLFVSGQTVSSNGVVARVHSTYATNVPPLSVEPFTGQATNAMQVLKTNSPTASMCVDSNGVTQVNPGGGLNPVGCYGSLMMNATNIVICAGGAGVYTNVSGTGYTTIVTNGFYGDITGNSAALTNLYGGWYRGAISLSALGANNQAIEAELFTNGVACDLISFKKTFDAAARMDTMSASGIIYLPAGCRTDFRVQDAGTGGSIAVHRASIVLGTP